MTEIDTYQKGNFKLEEWEDVNYCEHYFYKNDEGLSDKDIVDLLNEQDERIKGLLKELKQYKLNCLWCSYCTMDSASIHCLKREDIPYGMLDGKTHEYAMTCEFYDGGIE